MLVRTDIPLADQIVQVAHSCLEAGRKFRQPPEPCHLAVLAVPSQARLLDAVAVIEAAGVRWAVFCEPDEGMGYTAACSEPVRGERRRLFRRFSLWREGGSRSIARGPPSKRAS